LQSSCEGRGGDLRRIGQFSTMGAAAVRFASRARRAGPRLLAVALVAVVAGVLATAPGEAYSRATAAAAKSKTKAVPGPTGPVLAVVSIARQSIHVHDGTGLVAQAPVSTGMAGYRTPTGVFSVLQKRRHHRSNIYSNAPMPYMQRLTWSGIALHAGVLPGFPASHGCIRLPYPFAVELWGMTKVGTRVVVAPDDAPVLPIEDARLPAPRLAPLPLDDDRLREQAVSEVDGPALASAAGVKVADAGGELDAALARRLDPLQRTKVTRALAEADAVAKAKAAKLAAALSAARAAAAQEGATALRQAERALAAAERRRDWAASAAVRARNAAVAERAGQTLAAAEDGVAEAQRAADAALLMDAALSQEAFEAASAAAEAEEARREAAAAVKAAARAFEPITIFVSRKAARVYIRQAWQPIHEAAVTFSDAGRALGTHVYLAVGPAAQGDTMRWLSVSLPTTAKSPRPRRRPDAAASAAPTAGPAQETAQSVLERFELPEETRRFIGDRLWAGATLIVSDHAPSGETGVGTDFIVLTR
jgi:lipoprotein-anchoring transpeptidase ErfK/SrfK